MTLSKKSNKGPLLGLLGFVIAFALSFLLVRQCFGSKADSELKAAAQELNRQTPLVIDTETRLDSASARGASVFTYHYTLMNLEKARIAVDSLKDQLRPAIEEGVRTNPDLRAFRERMVTMKYRYNDKNGDFVVEITVSPETYQN